MGRREGGREGKDIIIIIIKSIYKAPCLRVIKSAQRRYTKVHSIPE